MSDDERKNGGEDFCFLCRRPERTAGKLFRLPNSLCICENCLRTAMDQVSNLDLSSLSFPGLHFGFTIPGQNSGEEGEEDGEPQVTVEILKDTDSSEEENPAGPSEEEPEGDSGEENAGSG